jgi:hypothetical protein
MSITPEIREAIERSGGQPVRLEDPQNQETYVILKASIFACSAKSVGAFRLR